MTPSVLGSRIRLARTAMGWTQRRLAAELSVEPMTVSRWERGATTPALDMLARVAIATGRPVSFLVAQEGSPTASEDLHRASQRIETAAVRVVEANERFSDVASDLVQFLRRADDENS